MKLFKKTIIATTLVLATLGVANATVLTTLPEISGSNLHVTVKDGVATLFGTSESSSDRAIAERHVAKMEGVDKVINLVTFQ